MPAPSDGRDVYSTGMVARLCGVAPRTVQKWIDAGTLPGYRLPTASRDRRVTRAALLEFLRANGMPVPPELDRPGRRVLLVGLVRYQVSLLPDHLPDDVHLTLAGTGFDAGARFMESHPDAVVIVLALGRGECLAMARSMRTLANGRPLLLVALAYEDEVALPELIAAGFDEVLFQPVDPAVLARRLTKTE